LLLPSKAGQVAGSGMTCGDRAGPGRARRGGEAGQDRYRLQFRSESGAELAAGREAAQQPLVVGRDRSISTEQCFQPRHTFPTRPPWQPGCGKQQLERAEQRHFRQFVEKALQEAEDGEEGASRTSFFELNLETWRQLWRVTEMSDILLLILDIRYAAATFPPALYQHIVIEQKKALVLVLNKVDLIPAELAAAWKIYFTENFPGINIVFFTSYPSYNLINVMRNGLRVKKLKANFEIAKEGALQILNICQKISELNLEDWRRLIHGEDGAGRLELEDGLGGEDQVLTLGTVGHPNVGKSSLINALLGRKRVSVSRTPGHTKHFQTIFLTRTVKLCDCPGLVFPSQVPRPLQVLMGSFPISQVHTPGWTANRY